MKGFYHSRSFVPSFLRSIVPSPINQPAQPLRGFSTTRRVLAPMTGVFLWIPDARYRIPDAGCRMPDSGCRILSTTPNRHFDKTKGLAGAVVFWRNLLAIDSSAGSKVLFAALQNSHKIANLVEIYKK